ncbi:MAG: metallophosphoesterase [Lachnospiraceae bacterium]|nr:metallophosphoesterase [Lachnospiraceae bacterium]
MWKAFAAGAAAAGIGCLLRSEYEKNHFVVEETVVSSTKIQREKRFVFLTDVHDKEFGPGNEKLLKAVAEAEPDGILIGGDLMVSKGNGDLSASFRLMEGLAKLGPVFYSLGNHEMRLGLERETYGGKYEELMKRAEELGITMLVDRTAPFSEDVWITGVDLHPSFYKKLFLERPVRMPEHYLEDKLGTCEKSRFQILLIHSPLYLKECAGWGADLSLCGHFHGGTVQIPGLGGLMTPQYQFFLPWCAGTFEEQGKKMIVGRGVGTHSINIRFNDKPQILVIRLTPEKGSGGRPA